MGRLVELGCVNERLIRSIVNSHESVVVFSLELVVLHFSDLDVQVRSTKICPLFGNSFSREACGRRLKNLFGRKKWTIHHAEIPDVTDLSKVDLSFDKHKPETLTISSLEVNRILNPMESVRSIVQQE